MKKMLCKAILILSFCDFLIARGNDRGRQTFVIRYKDGEQTIPVTVVLDYKKQTEYVLNMNPRSPAKSVTLYDFKQRTIAYKDLANNECFLGKLTHESLSEEVHALKDMKNPVEGKPKVRSLYPGRPALTPTEIRNIAGQKTAAFCGKMNTWLLMPEKAHSISKREADDEYEERTYHRQGYHTVHYAHYGRETRRRYRNPGLMQKHRSHRSQGAADNRGLAVPESTIPTKRHHPNRQFSNIGAFDARTRDNGINAGGRYSNSHTQRSRNPLEENRNPDLKENHISLDSQEPTLLPMGNDDFEYHANYPSFKAEFPLGHGNPKSNGNITVHHKAEYFGENSFPNFSNFDAFRNRPSVDNTPLTEVIAVENSHARTERSTSTTDASSNQNENQDANYPNVHPSLVHLLPLYKPLSREFEFDPQIIDENGTFLHSKNKNERNIETEFDPIFPTRIQPKNNIYFDSISNAISKHPDVSTDVLELSKLTEKVENIDHIPNGNFSVKHSSLLLNGHKIAPGDKIYLEENISYIPPLETFSTTESPKLTTPGHFRTDKLHSNGIGFVPFESNKDLVINAFHHEVSNSITNNDFIVPINSLNGDSIQQNRSKILNSYVLKNNDDSLITTVGPLREQNSKPNFSHRSDIPGEDNDLKSLPFSHTETNTKKIFPSETIAEGLPPYKIRYPNVLRDFKPDEIVIDIENIPTPLPLPVTSRFQRISTTVQPTIKSVAFDSVRSDIGRRSEQTLGTTWHTYIATTRHPRRKIHERTRKPFQNERRVSFRRGSRNHPQFQPSNPNNQHGRINYFNPQHQRFYRPAHPNPPPEILSAQPHHFNQLHRFNQLNNLPPGVSVHPRHPQAPFADMIHSNRPPTMPLVDDNQILKSHRHRHNGKKSRLNNSCCRLRGKPGPLQSCCTNGGQCCSRSHRRMQTSSSYCCPPRRTFDQVIPSNQIHRLSSRIRPPFGISNQIQQLTRDLPLRTESIPKENSKDRCAKAKMCRTVYESTQKVMVCRNANIEGC